MKKISIQFLFWVLNIFQIYSQSPAEVIEQNYEKRNLKIEEVNILGSYYTQDGNNSGVTGGVGTEKLTDYSSIVDIKLIKPSKNGNKSHIGINFGVDYYTSASSDQIDPLTLTSPSYSDIRLYPTISYAYEMVEKNATIGGNFSLSKEFDYFSKGAQIHFSKGFNKKQTEWAVKFNIFLDELLQIMPYELRGSRPFEYNTRSRNTYNLSSQINQTIHSKLQMALILDIAYQQGFLSTPFHRFFTSGASLSSLEILPDNRIKIPIGLRGNVFLNEKMILRNFYRFYWDNWGLVANTIQSELNTKLNHALTLSPSIRLYHQSGSKYFYPKNAINILPDYRTSDFDLSKFESITLGLGLNIHPANGILNSHFHSLELKYGYYYRTNGLNAHVISANIRIK